MKDVECAAVTKRIDNLRTSCRVLFWAYCSCVFAKRNYRVLVRVCVCACVCVCVCVFCTITQKVINL